MVKTPEYDSKEVIKNGPEMWVNEIRYIEKLLDELSSKREEIRILEWGSGYGTIYFANYLKKKNSNFKWTAIEHFLPWYDKVQEMIAANNLSSNVSCVLQSPTSEEDKIKQESLDLNDYINYPQTLDKKYHLMLVDGRRRTDCLKVAGQTIEKNGFVILHDAERDWFHESFKYFKDGGRFVVENKSPNSYGGIQKLWVGTIG